MDNLDNSDRCASPRPTTISLIAGSSQTDRDTAIGQAAAAAQAKILDVGAPNRQIDEIYIWRSRADGSRYSRYLVANYTPALGERVGVA